jgi:hypothetical protein
LVVGENSNNGEKVRELQQRRNMEDRKSPSGMVAELSNEDEYSRSKHGAREKLKG